MLSDEVGQSLRPGASPRLAAMMCRKFADPAMISWLFADCKSQLPSDAAASPAWVNEFEIRIISGDDVAIERDSERVDPHPRPLPAGGRAIAYDDIGDVEPPSYPPLGGEGRLDMT